jgi:hypothetical protein
MVKCPVGTVTAFTQLRTDTTLDLSQKAEKVCPVCPTAVFVAPIMTRYYGSPPSRIKHIIIYSISHRKRNKTLIIYFLQHRTPIFTIDIPIDMINLIA